MKLFVALAFAAQDDESRTFVHLGIDGQATPKGAEDFLTETKLVGGVDFSLRGPRLNTGITLGLMERQAISGDSEALTDVVLMPTRFNRNAGVFFDYAVRTGPIELACGLSAMAALIEFEDTADGSFQGANRTGKIYPVNMWAPFIVRTHGSAGTLGEVAFEAHVGPSVRTFIPSDHAGMVAGTSEAGVRVPGELPLAIGGEATATARFKGIGMYVGIQVYPSHDEPMTPIWGFTYRKDTRAEFKPGGGDEDTPSQETNASAEEEGT